MDAAVTDLHHGQELLVQGRHLEALTCLERAVQTNPRSHVAWRSLGVALTALHRYGEALTAYDRALALDPEDVYAWTSKGRTLARIAHF
jgi:cytochrome c-type biogenesis protein CcmH/NrfG